MGLFNNHILRVSILAWFIAQVLKVIITLLKEKRMDFTRFIGSGGMPSSHSAFVVSLATSVGLKHGWDSTYFAISAVFTLIVMYDAAGVRRATGKQAVVLNKIINEIHQYKEIKQERLKELIGHTPIEVFTGALLGALISYLLVS
ncbi:MAG: divergent PAP2 family protein [Mahellales bacterium]